MDLSLIHIFLLTELGGFDIAAMAGLFLGAAVYRLPAVIDGFISSAAALLAVLMCRDVKDFLLASHVSSEPAGRLVMDQLGLKAPLDLSLIHISRLLSEADVVIYAGSLVNPELLKGTKEGCEIHDSARMTLPEVLGVMERAEAENKTCLLYTSGGGNGFLLCTSGGPGRGRA